MKWFRHTHDRPRKILLLSKRWLAIPGALLCVCALCLVTTLPARHRLGPPAAAAGVLRAAGLQGVLPHLRRRLG